MSHLSRLLPLAALTTVTLLGMTASVKAAPITFLFTGIGTGTLGDTPFTNAAFTITALADTLNIEFATFGATTPAVLSSSTTISITGLSTATFTTPQRIFNNQPLAIVGVNKPSPPSSDRYDIFNATLGTYTLATAFGPVSGSVVAIGLTGVPTNLGTLDLTPDSLNGTFQAISGDVAAVAPEPGSIALVSVGLAAMAGTIVVRRRRARQATV